MEEEPGTYVKVKNSELKVKEKIKPRKCPNCGGDIGVLGDMPYQCPICNQTFRVMPCLSTMPRTRIMSRSSMEIKKQNK